MHDSVTRSPLVVYALAAVVLALTFVAYYPGLSGGFVFDDLVNLEKLGAFGPIDNVRTFLFYITSGIADPTGRPVSMLSFLIDARDWPADPLPFKRTNLVLHLFNGALLIALVTRLDRRLQSSALARRSIPQSSRWIGLLAGALWMLHPFFVSTTLYVVQREAMLPLTFALCALLTWDGGVSALERGAGAARIALTTFAVWALILLAGLSKANGFLVPLLGLVVFMTVYLRSMPIHTPHMRRTVRNCVLLAFGVPAAIIALRLAQEFALPLDYHPINRDWTVGERFRSQPRALIDYLRLLLLPRAGSGGVFVEHFPISRTWFQPWTTLPAIATVAGLVGSALVLVRRAPAYACAVLFFFTAHLMESSIIALEPYFEHRNYLPAALLFWPLARWLVRGPGPSPARLVLCIVLPLTLLALTWQRASAWGDPTLHAALSGVHNLESDRAQAASARARADAGDIRGAIQIVANAQAGNPESLELAINRLALECRTTSIDETAAEYAEQALLQHPAWSFQHYIWLQRFVAAVPGPACHAGTPQLVDRLLAAARRNPATTRTRARRQNWHFVEAVASLARKQPDAALNWFNRATELAPDPERALVQAAELGNYGYYQHGLDHLGHFRSSAAPDVIEIRNMQSLHRWLRVNTGYYEEELRILERKLKAALEEQP